MATSSQRWRVAQFFEIRWWQRYLGQQDWSAYLIRKQAYWLRILDVLDASINPEATVLEAGCGPAGLFIILPNRQVDAVDPLLNKYQEKLPGFSLTQWPHIRFHAQRLEDFQPANTYDWICCFNAINHVDDWADGLDRLTAAAKPGSTLLLGVDVHRFAALKSLFRAIPGDILHPHQHDREDYRKALNARNWAVEYEHTWKKGGIFDYCLIRCVRV
jgi:2-polyprenyl-6-hydroxyphenyl methylase/3-demethylubiquinone-9 3-methyltransferase